MKRTSSLVLVLIIVLSPLLATTAESTESTTLAYVYSTDTSTANSYKSFLDFNGYSTTLITMADVAMTDFSLYDLTIVGSDTGYLENWGDAASVSAVNGSKKPIIGLGEGGYSFFGELNLNTGWPNGWHGDKNSIYVADISHPVFATPNPITIPKDHVIQLYTTTGQVGIHLPSIPTNVVALGRESDDETHYPLTLERERYLLWGFTASPNSMTQVGKDLFLNIVYYLISLAVKFPLYLFLNIEDALEGITVNKVAGDLDGPTHYTRVDIVTKLVSYSSQAKDNIPVVLTIPSDLFGPPINAWVRNTNGGVLTSVSYNNLGGGRYLVTTDLSPAFLYPSKVIMYRKQIVWRFLIPNDVSPQDVTVRAQVLKSCVDPSSTGIIRILAPGSVRSIIIANRKLLYDKYADSEVTSLLQRLFTEAQGAGHTLEGVIYYVDIYDTRAREWDNTAVDYTNETTANVVANAIDDLVEDWCDDATLYLSIYIPFFGYIHLPIARPEYLLIVGDDDTIPFYRYDDPSNAEKNWDVNSAAPPSVNPAVWATDKDYILTDNPYADLDGGTDWQTGDIELWVGRLLGETASDMLSLLEEGVSWNNGQRGDVVMASVDGWELGLTPDDGRAGEIADICNVAALFRGKGFQVRNDDDPTSEVRTIDVMSPYEGGDNSWNTNFRTAANDAGGMDLFFIGGHDSYDHAIIPGDDFSPDDTPGDYTRFGTDHPIAMIVGCHGGLPVRDGGGLNGGADNDMVYDLIHEGARAYIGATGFSYGSPGDLHKCTWGERLIQSFFSRLLMPAGGNSMTMGKAMAEAKSNYVFGFGGKDYYDRKTVTEFNVYGVPWAFIFYPNVATALSDFGVNELQGQGFTTLNGPVAQVSNGGYSRTFEVNVGSYKVATETQERIKYDVFSIEGGDVAVADGAPILPYIEGYKMLLPFGSHVTDVKVVDSTSSSIGKYNIPIAKIAPFTGEGLRYTTETDIDYPYPKSEELVQCQETSEGLLFTIFPIQHNPTTDETTFYNHFEIQVTYESPLPVVITDFATNKEQYMPDEEIRATTRIENVGDVTTTLTGTMTIRDAFGSVAGMQTSDEFNVPSGESYVLPLAWSGMLNDGVYTVQIAIESEGNIVGGSSTRISVLSGEIAALTAPAILGLGEEGTFQVTFANFKNTAVSGQVTLTIQSSEGDLVEELAPQNITVPSGSTKTATFTWTPMDVSPGNYAAVAAVVVDGKTYGPTSQVFEVSVPVSADIKPGSWPNPINIRSKGVFAVSICGTAHFDVTTIDPATIKIYAEGIEQGVSPLRWSYEDVATPYIGDPGSGHELEGDGYLDLVLHFKTQETVAVLTLTGHGGETLPLIIIGNLIEAEGSIPIQGQDYAWIIEPTPRELHGKP